MDGIALLWLGVMSVEDWRKQEVSTIVLLLGGVLLFARSVYGWFAEGIILYEVISALCPGIVLLLLAFATGKIGAADGLAVLFLGLIAGVDRVWLVLCVSLLGMSAFSIVLLLCKKVNRQTGLPFFPFLFLGWGTSIFMNGGLL